MKKYIFGIIVIMFASIFATPAMADENPYHYNYNRILKHGSGGNDVVMAKFCLARVQNEYYDIHGYFDTATKGRVAAFQRANNLAVDGIIGNKTGAAMEAVCNGALNKTKEKENGHDSAHVDFTFKLRNTTNKDITIYGLHDLVFELEGREIHGDDLHKKDGYTLEFIDNQGKELKSRTAYIIKPAEKKSFNVRVHINSKKTKKGAGEYKLKLKHLNWKLQNKSKKTLVLNVDTEPIIIGNL